METNIELFDRYIDEELSAEEKQAFEARLHNDKGFRSDFRIYLFTLDGLCREMEQENVDFAIAMRNISAEGFDKIINRKKSNPFKNGNNRIRERFAWISSIAALFIVGLFSVITVMKSGESKVDDILVHYNESMLIDRAGGEAVDYTAMSTEELKRNIPMLADNYRKAIEGDDVQAQEIAGFTLAMAYLKIHDRKEAVEILREMTVRFADDEEFKAQCEEILSLLE